MKAPVIINQKATKANIARAIAERGNLGRSIIFQWRAKEPRINLDTVVYKSKRARIGWLLQSPVLALGKNGFYQVTQELIRDKWSSDYYTIVEL